MIRKIIELPSRPEQNGMAFYVYTTTEIIVDMWNYCRHEIIVDMAFSPSIAHAYQQKCVRVEFPLLLLSFSADSGKIILRFS